MKPKDLMYCFGCLFIYITHCEASTCGKFVVANAIELQKIILEILIENYQKNLLIEQNFTKGIKKNLHISNKLESKKLCSTNKLTKFNYSLLHKIVYYPEKYFQSYFYS